MTTFNSIKASFDPIREMAKADFIARVHRKIDVLRDDEGTIRRYGPREFSTHRLAAEFITWADNRMARGTAGVVNEERLDRIAQQFADAQVDGFIYKLEAKIGHLENVVLSLGNNREFVITGTHNGMHVRVDQQCVFKVSSKGTFFLQWPARIYVDGKFTPEKAFKALAA